MTRSVTVLDRQTIDQQTAISRDLGDVLANTVPGMATSTEGLTNFSQTLRGRKFLTLIDGVPISTPLRDGQRALKSLDPSAIERVEVLRGGTAAYGFGATGGLVNYITREPEQQKLRGFSEAGIRFNTEHPDGSLQWHTTHGASGQRGPVDYLINASVTERNEFFDSEGNRLPPEPLSTQGGFGDTTEWNVLAKFGFDFDDQKQRVEFMFNNYDINQDTDLVVSPGNPATGETATGVPGDPQNTVRTENEVASLTYEHRDVLGSELELQVYHQDFTSGFGTFPLGEGAVGYSTVFSEKTGTRLTIDTPLGSGPDMPKLIWGVDYQNDRTSQPIQGLTSLPKLDQNAVAGFAELELPISDLGQVRGGVRHEEFWLDVPTFQTIGGGTVQGGDLTYDATLFNLTGVAYLTDHVDLYGGFSQGFSLGDVGRGIRESSAGTDLSDQPPSGKKVDNYELGLRGDWDMFTGSVVGFYSETDKGSTFRGTGLTLGRNPQEIWGVESSLEFRPTEKWTVGGTATWIDSQADLDGDGDLDEELPIANVPPAKLTGFVEFRPFDWWNNRLQALYSGNRNPDAAGTFGDADIDDYVVFDYYAGFDVWEGNLQLGVENVMNEDYFPVASQLYGKNQAFALPNGFTSGQGRTVSLSYRIKW
jgi:iron complex outermembrane receptor protein